MTERDVRDLIVRAFEGIAERNGVARRKSHACALQLAAAVEAHGVRLVRPAAIHDPAADWRRKSEPGDTQAGANAARAALNGTGRCPLCHTDQALTSERTLTEHTVPDVDGNHAGCLGAGLEPSTMQGTEQ